MLWRQCGDYSNLTTTHCLKMLLTPLFLQSFWAYSRVAKVQGAAFNQGNTVLANVSTLVLVNYIHACVPYRAAYCVEFLPVRTRAVVLIFMLVSAHMLFCCFFYFTGQVFYFFELKQIHWISI